MADGAAIEESMDAGVRRQGSIGEAGGVSMGVLPSYFSLGKIPSLSRQVLIP